MNIEVQNATISGKYLSKLIVQRYEFLSIAAFLFLMSRKGISSFSSGLIGTLNVAWKQLVLDLYTNLNSILDMLLFISFLNFLIWKIYVMFVFNTLITSSLRLSYSFFIKFLANWRKFIIVLSCVFLRIS